jgi:hypothetical protein
MSYRDRKKKQAENPAQAPEERPIENELFRQLALARDQVSPDALASIVQRKDGTLAFRSFVLSPVGLMGEEITYEDWEALGEFLNKMNASIQWILGDWLLMGERTWGKTYESLAALLGIDISTLYNYTYVAANVEFSSRNEKLSFTHHKVVAPLPPKEQKYWLEAAVQNQWSISEMRRRIQGEKDPAQGDVFQRFIATQIRNIAEVDSETLRDRAEALRTLVDQIERVIREREG